MGETASEVRRDTDMPGVYNMLMVRMLLMELTN